MKKSLHNPKPMQLSAGYFLEKAWSNFTEICEGNVNWEYHCMYQLEPNAMRGKRWVLHLNTMQTNRVIRETGLMHSPTSSKDCFNILIVENCADKACYGDIKLKTGTIIFSDDAINHNFINNEEIEFTVITIEKSKMNFFLPNYKELLNHSIFDADAKLSATCSEVYTHFTNTSKKYTTQDFTDAENKILSTCRELLSEQIPKLPKLTVGEKIALEIREKVFKHMDGNVSVSSLANEYDVSEQTLQNSFKSLFGYTPNKFLRLLKLNLVHQELCTCNPKQTTVSKIAFKWGFVQMGQFGIYYKELFGENPSQTLQTNCIIDKKIKDECTLRKEEL